MKTSNAKRPYEKVAGEIWNKAHRTFYMDGRPAPEGVIEEVITREVNKAIRKAAKKLHALSPSKISNPVQFGQVIALEVAEKEILKDLIKPQDGGKK